MAKHVTSAELDKYDAKYCLNVLKTDEYLWDLRFWKKDHDRKEVEAWVRKLTSKNCGHVTFCIRILRDDLEFPVRVIVDTVLENTKLKYIEKKDRASCIGSIVDRLGAE